MGTPIQLCRRYSLLVQSFTTPGIEEFVDGSWFVSDLAIPLCTNLLALPLEKNKIKEHCAVGLLVVPSCPF